MHHPIDVVAGLLLGLAALVVDARTRWRKGVDEIDRNGRRPSTPSQVAPTSTSPSQERT